MSVRLASLIQKRPILAGLNCGIKDGSSFCGAQLYHLRERTIERQVLPWCEEQGVAVVGYSPFGSGRFLLTGEQANIIGDVASARGATVRQITLAFLTRYESLFAIPKSSDPVLCQNSALLK